MRNLSLDDCPLCEGTGDLVVHPLDLDDELSESALAESESMHGGLRGVYAGPCPECRGSGVVFRYDLEEHEQAWLRHLLGFDDDSEPPGLPDVDLLPDP